MAKSPEERLTVADVPPLRRRPIMTAGVALIAVAILSIIVLVPSAVHARWDLATVGAWPLAALMVLSFCVPCVTAIVVVVMANFEVPRSVRYALALISLVGASVPFCIMFMACVSETDSQGAQVAYSVLKNGVGWFCGGLVVLGACLGLSLPVADTPHPEKPLWERPRRARDIATVGALGWAGSVYQLVYLLAPYVVGPYADTPHPEKPLWERPRRARDIATVGALGWAGSVYQLVYLLAPYVVGPYAHGALTYFISQSVAAPMAAFFVTAFVAAIGWTQASFPEHQWSHRILVWVPLGLFLLTIANAFFDTLTLHGSYSLSYATYRISGVWVLEMCLLGILYGIGLSSIRD